MTISTCVHVYDDASVLCVSNKRAPSSRSSEAHPHACSVLQTRAGWHPEAMVYSPRKLLSSADSVYNFSTLRMRSQPQTNACCISRTCAVRFGVRVPTLSTHPNKVLSFLRLKTYITSTLRKATRRYHVIGECVSSITRYEDPHIQIQGDVVQIRPEKNGKVKYDDTPFTC